MISTASLGFQCTQHLFETSHLKIPTNHFWTSNRYIKRNMCKFWLQFLIEQRLALYMLWRILINFIDYWVGKFKTQKRFPKKKKANNSTFIYLEVIQFWLIQIIKYEDLLWGSQNQAGQISFWRTGFSSWIRIRKINLSAPEIFTTVKLLLASL